MHTENKMVRRRKNVRDERDLQRETWVKVQMGRNHGR
jgi:hypothetical protein